jgi:molecular chaperone GrpE
MARPDQDDQLNQNDETEATQQDSVEDAANEQAAVEALQQAHGEIADLKSKLVRWQADFQNLQRRTAREILESRQNADADFAKAMLSVLDHFDMALTVDPAKVDSRSILDGVKITYDELKKVLGNRGIEAYDPTGKPFDPHQHEAVMQEESKDHKPMMVIQTFQQGYRLGDRILRPAKVKVSK